MKASIPFILLLTALLWGFAFWWFYGEANKLGGCTAGASAVAAVKNTLPPFKFNNGGVKLFSPETFSFAKDGLIPTIPAKTKASMDSLANFLQANATEGVTVAGYYALSEANASAKPNLGQKRAEVIKNELVKRGAKAEQITTKGILVKENASNAKNIFIGDRVYGGDFRGIKLKAPVNNRPAFAIKNDEINLTTKENFMFTRNSEVPNVPASVKAKMKELGVYMKKENGNVFRIIGLYSKDEKNNTKYENLGLARAAEIRSELLNLKVPQDQIILGSELVGDDRFVGDKLYGFNGELLKVNAKDVTAADLAKPEKIYFEFGKDVMVMSLKLKQYLENVKAYLAKNPKNKAILTGHTDNVGNPVANKNLGKRRADFIKKYLANQGVKTSQMSTSSQGDKSPVADNKTDKGRALNRRVEIVIK